jgi:hypothetical protein
MEAARLQSASAALARLKCATAPSEGKVGQEQAHYGPAVSAARSCAVCANFDGNNRCAVVNGEISPTGTSDMFQPRPEMAAVPVGPVAAAPTADLMSTKEGTAAEAAVPLALLTALAGGGALEAYRGYGPHLVSNFAKGFARTGDIIGTGAGGAVLGGLAGNALAGTPGMAGGALLGGGLGAAGGARLARTWLGRAERPHKEKHMDKSGCNNLRVKRKVRPHMPSKGRIPRRRKLAELLEKCACTGGVMCAECKAARKYREVRPERREGNARFAWQGKGAKDITDDPGYEKYTRKAAAVVLAAILGG